MGVRRRGIARGSSAVGILIAVLAFAVPSAQALVTHPFSSQFGAGTLSVPAGVAVDNDPASPSFNDVYVADLGEPVNVAKFDAAGNPLSELTSSNITGPDCAAAAPFSQPAYVAVDASTGDVYVTDYSARTVTAFGPTGTCLFQISSSTPGIPNADLYPFGPAVDPAAAAHGNTNAVASGALYVANRDTGQIDEFDPATGAYIGEFGGQQASAFDSLAVDPSGNVYVMDDNTSVKQFSAAGVFEHTVSTNGTQAVGVDPSNGHILVGENGYSSSFHLAAYANPGDPPVETFGQGHFPANSGGYGIDVSKSTGTVYVSEISGNVGDIFSAGVVVPDVTTTAATNQSHTTATVNGHVDPDSAHGGGPITDCEFEYVDSADYNPNAPNPYSAGPPPVACSPATPIVSGTDVSANLSGLSALTTYHYRVVAANTNGANQGADQTFSTVAVIGVKTDEATELLHGGATLHGEFDPEGLETTYHFEYGTEGDCAEHPCVSEPSPASGPYTSGTTEHVSLPITHLQPEATYHYRIAATNTFGTTYGADKPFVVPPAVKGVTTEPATAVGRTEATLNGKLDPDGLNTEYHFQYGLDTGYGQNTATVGAGSAPGEVSVSPATVTGLLPNHEYHFRLVATDSVGTTLGPDLTYTTLTSPPSFTGFSVSEIHADSALLGAEINAGGGETTYHFEYGTEACPGQPGNPCTSFPIPDGSAGTGVSFQGFSAHLFELSAETEYHWRVVATNVVETAASPDHTFTTFPSGGVTNDTCPNAHVRQQTGAALLPDCRAYELVSAANAGGYNVESSLVPGESPFGGYPQAESPPRVLYAVHDGGIPGTNHPTNKGPDPYVATRGKEGWSTEYVGVPADNAFAAASFSSAPSGANASLDTFAFGAPGGCSPCFQGGYTGIPIRLSNGQLVQGMTASPSVTAPPPSAKPDGYIAKDLSADGSHFIFGSTSQFATGGNNGTGDVSIYDRDLKTGETHLVSDTPGGAPLACEQGAGACHSPGDGNGIAALDLSGDGSRIVVAQKVSTDADGNVYWHLYMDIGDASHTVDLTPGAADGVLYDGMTADGSKVFFTTKDALGSDTDTSADVYQTEVSETGAVTLTGISTGTGGTVGNTNSCDPVGNSNGTHWNTVGAGANCDAVALGGAGGVGATDGSIYLLSPELLNGASNGVQDQPNLYIARPGSSPHYVTTLEPNNPLVLDSVKAAGTRETGDFQITPDGNDAVFTTKLPLKSGYNNASHSEVYRYDAVGNQLDCVSCNPTNGDATGDASLAANGLSITNDGRVFFNSTDALAPRDLDEKEDVYEWEAKGMGSCQTVGGCVGLISTGSSPFSSGLLGISADGTDAYIFTRDTLVPQDQNGTLTKVYDARALGGFLFIPQSPPCAASDECHGPGTQAPQTPQIRTVASGPGNVKEEKKRKPKKCRSGFAKKHGKCVKKNPTHHKGRARHG